MPTRLGSAMPLDEVLDAPGDVVLHLVAPLVVAGVEELLAVAGRAAEVRLQHRVAAVGQELRHCCSPSCRAPTDRRAAPGSRGGSSLDALGQREVRGDLEPVRGLVAHRLHGGQVRARELFADAVLQRELLAGAVEEVGFTRFGVAGAVISHTCSSAVLDVPSTCLPGSCFSSAGSRPPRPCSSNRSAASRRRRWWRRARRLPRRRWGPRSRRASGGPTRPASWPVCGSSRDKPIRLGSPLFVFM